MIQHYLHPPPSAKTVEFCVNKSCSSLDCTSSAYRKPECYHHVELVEQALWKEGILPCKQLVCVGTKFWMRDHEWHAIVRSVHKNLLQRRVGNAHFCQQS